MRWLLALVAATALWGQVVAVSLSPLPQEASSRILGSRTAKIVMIWVAGLENRAPEPVLITESAIIRRIPQLQPYDRPSLHLVLAEAVKRSGWKIAGDVLLGLNSTGLFVGVPEVVKMPAWALKTMAGVNSNLPQAISWIKGADTPIQANFEALAGSGLLTLQPGDTGTMRIFTAPWDKPQPVNFEIDTSVLARIKVAR